MERIIATPPLNKTRKCSARVQATKCKNITGYAMSARQTQISSDRLIKSSLVKEIWHYRDRNDYLQK